MAHGLRIRDPATGQVTLSITDRITRGLGAVYTGTSNGSITVPEFSQGEPWYFCSAPIEIFNAQRGPRITRSGNVLSWDWDYPGGTRTTGEGPPLTRVPGLISYGIS